MFIPIDEFNYFKKTIDLYEYALINNVIKKYSEKNPNAKQILIPFDLEFNLMN